MRPAHSKHPQASASPPSGQVLVFPNRTWAHENKPQHGFRLRASRLRDRATRTHVQMMGASSFSWVARSCHLDIPRTSKLFSVKSRKTRVGTLDSTVDMFNGGSGSWEFKKVKIHASYLLRSIGFGYLAARTWLLAAFAFRHLAQNHAFRLRSTVDSRPTVDLGIARR